MMNEIEIAYWNIINRDIDLLEVPCDHFIELLMMTALQAKRMTCEPSLIRVFEAFLGHNYPQFMQNYETWKSQLNSFTEEEQIDFEKTNDSFRCLYAETAFPIEADIMQDLNFVVDSLEDEHVRRAVHTTKTQAEIEEENNEGGLEGNSKANQIAAMLSRRRGRGRYSSNAQYYAHRTSIVNNRGNQTPQRRRASSDDDQYEVKRSRSRSINT
jgi:hypothetical protein